MPSRRDFLTTGLCWSAVATFGSAAARGVPRGAAVFKAGAGRSDVVFPADRFPIDGFAGQHDPLAVRILLLDDGTTRLAVVVIDMTSISGELIARMKAIVTEITRVGDDNTIICASHTFSAPHVFAPDRAPAGTSLDSNAAALRAFETALRTAGTQAVSALRPARLGFGLGTSRINVNRDVETPYGWWLGANDAGFTDPDVCVVRVDNLDGTPMAILMNVAVQSSIMDGSERAEGGKLISADLAGAAARHVEAHFGAGTVALFLIGAAGDQAPFLQASRHVVDEDGKAERIDIHEAGFTLVDLLGARLGGEVVRVAETIMADQAPVLTMRRESVQVESLSFSPRNMPVGPVKSYTYPAGAEVAVPVVLIGFGDTALVGVQPELAASIGARLKSGSPYARTMVATMVDGAAKYMADARSYDRFTYEARNSPFAKGAAEATAAGIEDLLSQMKNRKN